MFISEGISANTSDRPQPIITTNFFGPIYLKEAIFEWERKAAKQEEVRTNGTHAIGSKPPRRRGTPKIKIPTSGP